MYNKNRFIDDFKGTRIKEIIRFCERQNDWFVFDDLFNFSINEAKKALIQLGNSNSTGSPYQTRKDIFYLLKMGYLLADPKKGLKVNSKFIPRNQRPLL